MNLRYECMITSACTTTKNTLMYIVRIRAGLTLCSYRSAFTQHELNIWRTLSRRKANLFNNFSFKRFFFLRITFVQVVDAWLWLNVLQIMVIFCYIQCGLLFHQSKRNNERAYFYTNQFIMSFEKLYYSFCLVPASCCNLRNYVLICKLLTFLFQINNFCNRLLRIVFYANLGSFLVLITYSTFRYCALESIHLIKFS